MTVTLNVAASEVSDPGMLKVRNVGELVAGPIGNPLKFRVLFGQKPVPVTLNMKVPQPSATMEGESDVTEGEGQMMGQLNVGDGFVEHGSTTWKLNGIVDKRSADVNVIVSALEFTNRVLFGALLRRTTLVGVKFAP
ncbi:MAG TPA: hypothetical protein ENJ50_05010 [Planctomycetaceae bacterium]|nr:hypothetical protein [Planctomycetaceae bacterium]